jgi:ribosome-binding protein aMBF1 (putative translation factor)
MAISGQDVRQWRQRVGLSVRALAKLIHVCNSTLFRWESGRSCISPKNQMWLQLLFYETARRQPRRREMDVCKHCQGTGLLPHNADRTQTPP